MEETELIRFFQRMQNRPCSIDLIRNSFPNHQQVDQLIVQMASKGVLINSSVKFTDLNMNETQNEEITEYFYMSPNHRSCPTLGDSEEEHNKKQFLESLQQIVNVFESCGTESFPSECFPANSTEKVYEELLALRKLRDKHVSRLWELNDQILCQSPQFVTKTIPKATSSVSVLSSSSSVSQEIARLNEHKDTKLRMRGEMKDLLTVLAGLMADSRNCTISEVIEEYT